MEMENLHSWLLTCEALSQVMGLIQSRGEHPTDKI